MLAHAESSIRLFVSRFVWVDELNQQKYYGDHYAGCFDIARDIGGHSLNV